MSAVRMKLDFDRYIRATMHLDMAQRGALWTLLLAYGAGDYVPGNDMQLACMCGYTRTVWLRRIWPALAPFFVPGARGRLVPSPLVGTFADLAYHTPRARKPSRPVLRLVEGGQ